MNDIAKYPLSSYNDYSGKNDLCDIKFPLSLIAANKKEAMELFEKFNKEETKDQCLEYEEVNRIDDLRAIEIIKEISGAKVTTQTTILKRKKEIE